MIVAPKLSRRVTTLLNHTNLNNDFKAKTPAGVNVQQYKLPPSEVVGLKNKVTQTYAVATQRKIVEELYQRSELPLSVGGIQLTKTSASQLTKWAKELNLAGVTFQFNQPRPTF